MRDISVIIVGHGVRWHATVAVVGAFTVTTTGMMLLQVHCVTPGVPFLRGHRFEHALQGISRSILALRDAAIRIPGI